MKNNMLLGLMALTIAITLAVTQGVLFFIQSANQTLRAKTITSTQLSATILATGSIHSTNEATLHFPTGGKLIYLPFKQGDNVQQGQTIAQLDTYALQQQLTQALNTYRSTRDTFDQTQANAQSGVLQGSQKNALNLYSQSVIGGDQENVAINDAVKRIVDQNQANLDNSVINVQLANYALQLATLTAPFSGTVVGEDVTVANQIITPATSFSLADPTSLVFRANVPATDIDYVEVGSTATVQIKGFRIPSTIVKIYPQKMTLPTGEEVYQVDVQSPSLTNDVKLGEDGNVLIDSTLKGVYMTVPSWAIVGHNYIWVLDHNHPLLKSITIVKEHDGQADISGLPLNAQVIINPESIAAQKYSLL